MMATTTGETSSILAVTEPAVSGAEPRIVQVQYINDTVLLHDVPLPLSAADHPLPDTNTLPTVTEALHTTTNAD